MLSEIHKFGVGTILAGQYCSQIARPVLDAILGNVGTLLVFRIGAQDASLFARQLGDIRPEDLINLSNYRMFVRLMIDGNQSKTFTATTFKQ